MEIQKTKSAPTIVENQFATAHAYCSFIIYTNMQEALPEAITLMGQRSIC